MAVRKDRTRRGGGVLCYVRHTLRTKPRKNISMANAECVWLQVLPDHQQPFLVGCLYRPSNGSLPNSDKGERLRQCASDLGYKQWISEPTRSTATSSTTIDLIFAPESTNIVEAGVAHVGITDHDMIYCVKKYKIHNPPPKYIKTRSWKNLEDRAVQEDCAQFPFASLFTAPSVDHAWEVFKSFALCVIDRHAPVKEPLEVANAFNDFFTSVGATLAKKFQDVPRTISTRSENRFKFQPVSAEAVCKQLRGLKTYKAHGVDGIPARLLKVAARELALPIATIFNYSLSTGTIPAEWKQARVTPIFKEGNKQDTSNYRPISVLPLCMKVFERLVHNQFHTHITTNNLLNHHQSGFRPKHSTTTALIDVTDHLYNQSQNGLIIGAIFLDLKKAFDTVNPVILQEKLRAIGVHGTELQWFDNYFTNRTQVVSANGAVSTTQPISCGVPQGSILGPLLFTLYVNDLSSVAVHGKVVLYADDTAIFVSGKNIEDIQGKLNSDLERITELSTLSHSHLYNHEQQSLRFVEHPYNFNIANKTCA